MKIALFGASKPEACRQIEQILHTLPGVETRTAIDGADMVVSVGGDGTFLRAAVAVGQRGTPILGVNAGRLGFLADLSLDEAPAMLPAMLRDGAYRVEGRALLQLGVEGYAETYQPFALNEIAVLKHDQSSMVSITVSVDGTPLNTYDADGVIIATPTGSTAYAMSAGGPILEPHSDCFEILPVAPHSLTTRPLVLRDQAVLDIEVASRNGMYLVAIDGLPLHLSTHHRLCITRAPHKTYVVRRPDHTFFDTLRQKLMWGADARY